MSTIFLCRKISPASNTPASSGSQNKAVAVRITVAALPPENDVQKNNNPAAAVITIWSSADVVPERLADTIAAAGLV